MARIQHEIGLKHTWRLHCKAGLPALFGLLFMATSSHAASIFGYFPGKDAYVAVTSGSKIGGDGDPTSLISLNIIVYQVGKIDITSGGKTLEAKTHRLGLFSPCRVPVKAKIAVESYEDEKGNIVMEGNYTADSALGKPYDITKHPEIGVAIFLACAKPADYGLNVLGMNERGTEPRIPLWGTPITSSDVVVLNCSLSQDGKKFGERILRVAERIGYVDGNVAAFSPDLVSWTEMPDPKRGAEFTWNLSRATGRASISEVGLGLVHMDGDCVKAGPPVF